MKEELTREEAQETLLFAQKTELVSSGTVIRLATALLEEMDKPKVWDGAPENATLAEVVFKRECGELFELIHYEEYTRKLPKTRIDEIVEEVIDGRLFGLRMEKSELTEILKSALEKYAAELKREE